MTSKKSIKAIVVYALITLSGCSSKVGLFISANIYPLSPKVLILSDGYKATYYTNTNGDSENINTFLFFIHGSERASLYYYFRDYFKELNKNVKVFSLQKRYIGHRETGVTSASKEFHRYNYFSQWVKDQKEFIHWILKNQDYSNKNILIFGVSEGGNVVAALVSDIPQTSHLMILGSGGMKGIDEFRLWGKRLNIDFDQFYRDVKKYPDSIEKKGYGQTYKYWASILPVDPMDYLKKINIPILVAIGGKDDMVPIKSVYFMTDEFNRLHKQNLTVRVFSDSDHYLIDSDGKNHRRELFQYAYAWWNGT